jgi:putative DNA primase/helicase
MSPEEKLAKLGVGVLLPAQSAQARQKDAKLPGHTRANGAPPPEDNAGTEDRPPAFSDDALAIRFAKRHVDELRYVAEWGKWLSWASDHWRPDKTLRAFDLARVICRAAATECTKARISAALTSAKTVAAIERMAKADRKLAATDDQWDGQLDEFNEPTEGGTK